MHGDKGHDQGKEHIGVRVDGLGEPDGFHPADDGALVLHLRIQLNAWYQVNADQQPVQARRGLFMNFLKRFTVVVGDRQGFIAIRESSQFQIFMDTPVVVVPHGVLDNAGMGVDA